MIEWRSTTPPAGGTLGYPPLVMPTHWDGYRYAPLRQQALTTAHQFADEVRAASPILGSEQFASIVAPIALLWSSRSEWEGCEVKCLLYVEGALLS